MAPAVLFCCFSGSAWLFRCFSGLRGCSAASVVCVAVLLLQWSAWLFCCFSGLRGCSAASVVCVAPIVLNGFCESGRGLPFHQPHSRRKRKRRPKKAPPEQNGGRDLTPPPAVDLVLLRTGRTPPGSAHLIRGREEPKHRDRWGRCQSAAGVARGPSKPTDKEPRGRSGARTKQTDRQRAPRPQWRADQANRPTKSPAAAVAREPSKPTDKEPRGRSGAGT